MSMELPAGASYSLDEVCWEEASHSASTLHCICALFVLIVCTVCAVQVLWEEGSLRLLIQRMLDKNGLGALDVLHPTAHTVHVCL
jgi:hypothetical protein